MESGIRCTIAHALVLLVGAAMPMQLSVRCKGYAVVPKQGM